MTRVNSGTRVALAMVLSLAGVASFTGSAIAAEVPAPANAADTKAVDTRDCVEKNSFLVSGAKIRLFYTADDFELKPAQICSWVEQSALAVGNYFGRFPVSDVRVILERVDSRKVATGTTFGQAEGGPKIIIKLGDRADQGSLDRDWVMTHEFVHLAVPSVPEQSHWLEEGIATYVEPIARIQTGQLSEAKVWNDMVRDMPKGLPEAGDQGLDRTPTWGRTYWGGALFCLLADIEVRKRTDNRKSLRDALRGVLASGGNIEKNWSPDRFFAAGDKAIGVPVLTELYKTMSTTPGIAKLDDLWRQLGVKREDDQVMFSDNAPLSSVREGLTSSEPSRIGKRPS